MNKTRQMKRQIYNKKALEKAQQANRTQRPKRNIGKEIIQELEQHDKSKEDSIKEESFSNGLLEYPQYTRPEIFEGERVPEILLSGHHEKINEWRKQKSLEITMQKRPDLLK